MLRTIQRATAYMVVDCSVHTIPAQDQEETTRVIDLLVRRERMEGREPKMHGHKTAKTLKDSRSISSPPYPALVRGWLATFCGTSDP